MSWNTLGAWLIEVVNMACFEPLGLAVSVHDDLPFLTDLGNAYTLQPNATLARAIHEGFGEAIDYFLRAIVWGVFIILVTIALLAMTSVYYYCVGRLCYKRKWSHRPKSLLWGCGLLSIFVVVLCIPMVCVGFWAEVELDKSLANFISNTTSGDAADAYWRAEQARHWLVTAFLILILLLLVLMIVCTVLSPILETSLPVAAMLVVFFVTTFLTSLLTGVGFTFLIGLADICVGLSIATNDPVCMQQGFLDRLEFYCNDGYTYGFTLFGLGCGFIVMFVIIQIIGAFFAGVFSGSEKYHRATVVPENAEPTAPEREETQPPDHFFVGGTQYQTGMSSDTYRPQSVLHNENNCQPPVPDSSARAISNQPMANPSDPPPHYDEVAADQSVNNTWRPGASTSFEAGQRCDRNNHNEETGL